jgi:UDP-N-acetylmuramate dehydrogenase
MEIRENVSLNTYTTLGVPAQARYFVEVDTVDAVREACAWASAHHLRVQVIGEGSNILIGSTNIDALIIKNTIGGIAYTTQAPYVLAEVGGGVLLDNFIETCVEKGFWGLENLSGIPGTIGATPIQNVGAYGVEVGDVIVSVHVYDMEQACMRTLSRDACTFAYRDSMFKHDDGKNFIITAVTYKLSLQPHAQLTYKDIAHLKNESCTQSEIRNTILAIRKKKFPDWHRVGTAGSFFKNPCIPVEHFTELQSRYPELPGYETATGNIKVSLGYILDKICGLRGYCEYDVALYQEQALVLTCKKGTSYDAINTFADRIAAHVYEKTNIAIEREVTTML